MIDWKLLTLVRLMAATFAAALVMASHTEHPVFAEVFASASRSAETIPRYGLLELSFKHNGVYDNNFFDVSLEAIFLSPSGSQRRIKGFYYGGDLWKIRFRPDEPGRWAYTYVMTGKGGFSKQGGGDFACTPGDAEGPVLRHPENPYRWVFGNGKPYFPMGLQTCITARGSQFPSRRIDGEKRRDNGRMVSLEDYFSIYGRAGFNLFRFSQNNCSYALVDDLDSYRVDKSIATDELLALARQHGFRVMFGFFGFHMQKDQSNRFLRFFERLILKVLGQRGGAVWAPNRAIIAKEKRFINYCVARWGVYADFWELLNERRASDEWTTMMANYVRSVDLDQKPISTSWEKPHLPAIDINSPHWYESESEFQSDLRVQQQATTWKRAGKPVIVGEQGNTGMNWDSRSGLRMRIRTWTALFEEISFIFWNTSWSKAGMFHGLYSPGRSANIYLGPEERGYIRVLQEFSTRLDAGGRITPVRVSTPARVRVYGLLSNTVAAVYLHHIADHTAAIHGVQITLTLPPTSHSTAKLVGEWIEPSTGKVLTRVQMPSGRQTLDVPPFPVDLALLVTSDGNQLNLRHDGASGTPRMPAVAVP